MLFVRWRCVFRTLSDIYDGNALRNCSIYCLVVNYFLRNSNHKHCVKSVQIQRFLDKCCKIFKVCLTILWHCEVKGLIKQDPLWMFFWKFLRLSDHIFREKITKMTSSEIWLALPVKTCFHLETHTRITMELKQALIINKVIKTAVCITL